MCNVYYFLGYLLFVSTNFTVDIIRYLTYGVCGVFCVAGLFKARLIAYFYFGYMFNSFNFNTSMVTLSIGFSLPHGSTDLYENGFHILTNYYFFLLNGYPGEQLIPRFTKYVS